ncbi:MAG: polysaccharide biosynthesis/export family protein [Terriglobia bacterium]
MGLVAVLIAVGSLCGQGQPPGRLESAPAPDVQQRAVPSVPGQAFDYIIAPDDDLEIFVMDVPELSHEYSVSPAGLISISLLKDPILAAGLTPIRLSQVIAKELQTAGMLDNPHITVRVKQSRLHAVAILGAVKRPQIYPIFGTTTLMDALSQAEGLAVDAGNTAIVTRGETAMRALAAEDPDKGQDEPATPTPSSVKVDLNRLLERGDPDANVILYPGDRVSVQRAGIVYVVGAVVRSGGFVLTNEREQMTVLKAVALAENLKSTAQAKKAVIIRKDPSASSGTDEIPVDLKRIMDGHAPDKTLMANDILFVPESGFKRAGYRAAEAAAQGSALLFYRVP